jgi:hypothetical protein
MSPFQRPRDRRFSYVAAAIGLAALVAPMFAGCGSPPELIPKGAWSVSFIDSGIGCNIAGHNTLIGEVSADKRTTLVEDGTEETTVVCSVIDNGGSFTVEALESAKGSILNILINELKPGSTKDAPSKGTVSYTSQNTAKAFTSTECNFYFLSGTQQGVREGEVWFTFDCPEIATGADNICTIDPGYAAFEQCHSVAEQ